jgi:hypothetical protein
MGCNICSPMSLPYGIKGRPKGKIATNMECGWLMKTWSKNFLRCLSINTVKTYLTRYMTLLAWNLCCTVEWG